MGLIVLLKGSAARTISGLLILGFDSNFNLYYSCVMTQERFARPVFSRTISLVFWPLT
jgi:hypothetical protein